VLQRVLKRLLHDPEHVLLRRRHEPPLAAHAEVDVFAVNPTEHVDSLLQRRDETVRLELRGPQLEDQRPHLLECVGGELPHRQQLLPRLLGLRLGEGDC
jgi:hypothetical protein